MSRTFGELVEDARAAATPRAKARLLARALSLAATDSAKREALLARSQAELAFCGFDVAIDDALLAMSLEMPSADEAEALVVVARGFQGKGMWREAERYVTRALDARPDHAVAHGVRGHCRLRQGDVLGALADLDAALATDPALHEARLLRGRVRADAGAHDAAVDDFDVVAHSAEHRAQALHQRGMARLAAGDLERSQRDLERAVDAGSEAAAHALSEYFELTRAREHMLLGRYFSSRDDEERAAACFRRAIESGLADEAEQRQSILDLGMALNLTGRYDEAARAYTKAIEADPSDALAFVRRGVAMNNAKRDGDAMRDYAHALALDPRLADAYLQRGALLMVTGDDAAAVADLTRAIELEPDDPRAFYYRAFSRARQRRVEEAKRDYFDAEERGHEDAAEARRERFGLETADDHFSACTGALAVSEPERAREHADRAIELFARDARVENDYAHRHMVSAYSNRGYARSLLGDLTGAIVDYQVALSYRSDYVDALVNLGNAYQRLGEAARAVEAHTKAVIFAPRSANGYYGRGRVYLATGDFEAAERDFSRALEIGYSDDRRAADAYYNRAQALTELGRIDDALSDLEEARDLAYPELARDIAILDGRRVGDGDEEDEHDDEDDEDDDGGADDAGED